MKNKIFNPLLFLVLPTLSSCMVGELEMLMDEGLTELTFNFEYDGSPAEESVDTSRINQVMIVICEDSGGNLKQENVFTRSWANAKDGRMKILLKPDKSYQIMFWVQNKDNTAYHIKGNGQIVVDYTDYLNAGSGRMKEMHALYGTVSLKTDSQIDSTMTIGLKCPIARLRFTVPVPVESSIISFHDIPLCFDPFADTVYPDAETEEFNKITFTFNDLSHESSDSGYYISENYFLVPVQDSLTINCTAGIIKDGVENFTYKFDSGKSIKLAQGGDYEISVTEASGYSKWSIWDGIYPAASTLTTDPSDPRCYIIDNAEDIAWLSDAAHTSSIGSGCTFKVVTDINMAHKPLQKPLQLPANSTFDGNGHTIKGFELSCGIFGEKARNLKVKNLVIEDSRVESTETANTGMLVNTLNGSSSFSNVSVINSYISALDGAAGGMVGYISRKSKSSRAEKMDVVFEDCHIYNTTISGTTKEGCFVGLLRGYDNGEKLTFRSDCSAGPVSIYTGLNSTYTEGNESAWLTEIDFSAFNSWLGGEECYRAIVMYGENRYIPRWDGTTLVKPLLANPEYDDTAEFPVIEGSKRIMIYSAFDLAGACSKIGASPAAIYFRENVDMNGSGADGITYIPEEFSYSAAESSDDNYLTMFTYVDLLEGENHTIYNMNITSGDGTITNAAFIRSTRKATETVHRNLTFYNCNVISKVKPRTGSDGIEEDLASGAIVIGKPSSSSEATYTMENIHVYNSRVFALQGIGILAAHFRGRMDNCSVNNCYIENYPCEDHLEPFSYSTSISGGEVTVSTAFYSYGEVGGLSGMLFDEAEVSDSHVRGTTILAWGQDDQEAAITGEGTLGKLAAAAAYAIGYYLVPGRHIGTMFGDVRVKKGKTITVNGCTVDDKTRCLGEQDMHSSKVPFIGQAYYIEFLDTKGTVTVDGHTLTLADCNRNTVRD